MNTDGKERSPSRYAAFITYSTASDYRLARTVHRFLSSFHEEAAIKSLGVKAQKFCMDGVTFRQSRDLRRLAASETSSNAVEEHPPERIRKIIRPYLLASDSLVVLWPGPDLITPSVVWELQEFLKQNSDSNVQRPAWLTVTRGEDPTVNPIDFFAGDIIPIDLYSNIYFDLRGFYPESEKWKKVRDFNEEQLRLAAELFDIRDSAQQPLSADDLLPAWKIEKVRRLRRTRTYAIIVAVAMTLSFGVAVYQARRAKEQKQLAVRARDAEATQRENAVRNKERAEKEQRNAEQLVRRMQSDIHEALLSLGRMDLMFAINEAVGQYLRESTSDSQGKLALKAIQHQQQGETYLSLSEPEHAREQFEKALEYAQGARWNVDSGWQGRTYAWLLLRLAELLKNGEKAGASDRAKWLAEVEGIAEKQLSVKDPPSEAFVLWASALAEQSDGLSIPDQEACFAKILQRLTEASDKLSATALSDRHALALAVTTTRHSLITSLRKQGMINQALELAEANVALLKQNQANTSEWRIEYARSLAVAGDFLSQQNIWQKAFERFSVSTEITERVIQDEPRQIEALRIHLHCLSQLLLLAGEMKVAPEETAKLSQRINTTKLQINRMRPSEEPLP